MIFNDYIFKGFTYKDYSFLNLKNNHYEIPIGNHPGAFGFKRKHHYHEGLDIYCKPNTKVSSITNGIVIQIGNFTGNKANSPWWNDTEYIAIKYKDKVIVYGEILVSKSLKINDTIKTGDSIGKVIPVLKKVKNNRPDTMLHLEYYESDSFTEPKEWRDKKPEGLLSPLSLFDSQFKMEYPNKEKYEFLYKKYIHTDFYLKEKSLEYKNKKILDICGGAGYTTKALYEMGATIDYFDYSKDMISESIKNNNKINKFYGLVEKDLPNKTYDYMFCQQAINYWFLNIDIKDLYNRLNRDAYLIFNTFDIKEKYIEKEYNIDNTKYIEISDVHNKKIYHIQIAIKDGIYYEHRTLFDKIKEEEYIKRLSPYFNIEIIKNKSSRKYICQKINNINL